MRLPPSQHHTGLLSTRARKSAAAGGAHLWLCRTSSDALGLISTLRVGLSVLARYYPGLTTATESGIHL